MTQEGIMSKSGWMIALLLASPWGQAAELDALNRCVSVVDHLERLQCYDSTMRQLQNNSNDTPELKESAPVVTIPLIASGGWTIKRDPNDEENNIVAQLKVDPDGSSASESTSLNIKCRKGRAEVSIAWLSYIGRDVYVTSGEKGLKGKRENWRLTDNDTTSIYPFNSQDLIKQFYNMEYLVAQVQPVSDGALVANFKVAGLKETLRPHKALCGL